MRNIFDATAVGAIATHHAIETAAGLGLPGEPQVGRGMASVMWGVLFTANLLLLQRRGVIRDAAVGFANGVYQALALQHYVDWPWEFRMGVPMLTGAEELPERIMPSYNAALLTTVATSAAALIVGHRPATALGHAAGLATLPLQLSAARHHMDWLHTASGRRSV